MVVLEFTKQRIFYIPAIMNSVQYSTSGFTTAVISRYGTFSFLILIRDCCSLLKSSLKLVFNISKMSSNI